MRQNRGRADILSLPIQVGRLLDEVTTQQCPPRQRSTRPRLRPLAGPYSGHTCPRTDTCHAALTLCTFAVESMKRRVGSPVAGEQKQIRLRGPRWDGTGPRKHALRGPRPPGAGAVILWAVPQARETNNLSAHHCYTSYTTPRQRRQE